MALTKEHITDALALIDEVSISATDDVFDDLAQRLNAANTVQKNHYQSAWTGVTKRFESARGNTSSLAELLDHINGVPTSNGITISDVGSNQITINMAGFVPNPGHMVIVRNGRYEMVPNETTDTRLIDAIIGAMTNETQAVIELGCGWGRNLASTAINTDRRELTFIGLEQSVDGLRCTEELLSKDPTVTFETNHFDFYNPDFSDLKKYKNVIVFSCAAIEQIALIGADFIDQVMSIADSVTLIFQEPFGWQRIKQLQEFGVMTTVMEIMGNTPPEKHHQHTYSFDLVDNSISANAVSWSIAGKYNLNLWSVIQHAVARNLVDMNRAEFDIFGLNPFNPYSLVVLNKRSFLD